MNELRLTKNTSPNLLHQIKSKFASRRSVLIAKGTFLCTSVFETFFFFIIIYLCLFFNHILILLLFLIVNASLSRWKQTEYSVHILNIMFSHLFLFYFIFFRLTNFIFIIIETVFKNISYFCLNDFEDIPSLKLIQQKSLRV